MGLSEWYAEWKARQSASMADQLAKRLVRQLDMEAKEVARAEALLDQPICPMCIEKMNPVLFRNKDGKWYVKAWWCRRCRHYDYELANPPQPSLTIRVHTYILGNPGKTETDIILALEETWANVNAEITRLKNQHKIEAAGGKWYPSGYR